MKKFTPSSKAADMVQVTGKPKTYVAQSSIENAGDGLYSINPCVKNIPIVIYYGLAITDQEVYDIYTNHRDDYYEISDYLRGTPNGCVIYGDKNVTNPNLHGVYVNDISSLNCQKSEINHTILRKYADTKRLCNLKVVDTKDFPVYVTTKRINRGEEFYVHYGIGYWLSHLKCSPEEISDLNSQYHFESFYS